MEKERPGILILAKDAPDYAPFLQDLNDDLQVASSAEEAAQTYTGQAVLLGSPDLAAPFVQKTPGIEWVQSTWAGVTPFIERPRRDYLLTGIKDVFGFQMAEYVVGYLLHHELDIRQRLEQQQARCWWPHHSGTLSGRDIGIMGTGSIGRHIATVAASFGMRVSGFSRGGAAVSGFDRVFGRDQLHEFLAGLDYLVGVLPDTPATRGLLDETAFAAMKRGAVLVNVGRGSLVDEVAMLGALESGTLAGAVLDVFGEEPLPPDSALWAAPGLIVTAHIAAISRPADIAAVFRDNYLRHRSGQPLAGLIDFDRGY